MGAAAAAARRLRGCRPSVRGTAALPMWEGDKYFLPLVFDDDPRPFWAVMPWVDGRPVDWRVCRL